MTAFLWHVLLTSVWAGATGSFAITNLLLGAALGYLVLVLTADAVGARRYVRRVVRVALLLGVFLLELAASNLRVAYDVVTPRPRMRPAVLAVPLTAQSDIELLLLTTMITLTPGNLTLEVSEDRQLLYVHAMYAGDPEAARSKIKDRFERAVLKVTR